MEEQESIKKIHEDKKLMDIIQQTAEILKNGGTAIIPTETVYGLAADARNERAVKKIFEIKRRPFNDPLIVHIPDKEFLSNICAEIPSKALILADKLWPGPLTMVLRKKKIIPDCVTAGLPTVAVRVPMHPITLELLRISQIPLAAPSANLFSSLSPTRFSDLSPEIFGGADIAIDGGDCVFGIESTIISLIDEKEPLILRAGSLNVEKIESLIGKVYFRKSNEESSESPGLKKKHYSPKTPLHLIKNLSDLKNKETKNSALLAFRNLKNLQESNFKIVKILPDDCDFRKAASSLYSTLAELDRANLDAIFAILPNKKDGLGIAIIDRLTRASSR